METEILTQSNIMFVLGLLGIIFSVYNYFRNPQEEMEKKQAVAEQDVESKAKILAQQLEWYKSSNDEKFGDMGERLDSAFKLAQNHIHSVDIKVDTLTSMVNSMNVQMSNKITELATIIDNRIPKN